MLKLIYFDGSELELSHNISLKRAKEMAAKNETIYQIARNNGRGDVYWERECPAE